MRFFGTNQQNSSPEIRLGIAGQGDAGKTVLLRAIETILCDINPGPGLELADLNAELAKKRYSELHEATEAFRTQGSVRTTTARDFRYAVVDGTKQVMTFVYHDAIGQLLQQTELDDPDKKKHAEFVNKLSHADILWAVIPVRDVGGDIGIQMQEISIVKQYIADAIRLREARSDASKVSVAVVLTKADVLGQGGFDEAKPTLAKLVNQIGDRFFNLIERSPSIWSGVVFPVSAFGFENSTLQETSTDSQHHDEKRYLVDGDSLNPWNIDKLLLWSLASGLEQPRGRPKADKLSNNIELTGRINGALALTGGPALVLKSPR